MSQRDLRSCWDLRCCILVGSASSIVFTDGLVAIAVAASSRSGLLRTGCLLQCWWIFVLVGGSHMKYRLVGVGYVCCASVLGIPTSYGFVGRLYGVIVHGLLSPQRSHQLQE